jgi:hypothetical protein
MDFAKRLEEKPEAVDNMNDVEKAMYWYNTGVADGHQTAEVEESNSTPLLCCPFCGAQPKLTERGNDHTKKRSVTIKCPKCRIERTDAALKFDMAWLVKTATENWNNRAI